MSRQFSQAAKTWLRDYHGSIDATALLLAYEAGQQEGTNHVLDLMDESASRDDWGVMAVYPSIVRKKLVEEVTA